MAVFPGGAGHSSGALTMTQASELSPDPSLTECSSGSTRKAPGVRRKPSMFGAGILGGIPAASAPWMGQQGLSHL